MQSETPSPMKLVVMQPTGESIDRRHIECLEAFEFYARCMATSYQRVRVAGSSLLEHARCELATRFLEQTDGDVLLWLDSDMTWTDREALFRMCQKAYELRAIVGAVSLVKRPLGQLNTRFLPETEKVVFFDGGDLLPIRGIGTGVCAVSREAFRKVEPRVRRVRIENSSEILTFYRSLIINGQWWGEDTSFCYLAEQEGVPIFADTRVRVGHRGAYEYHVEDSGQAVELRERVTVRLKQPKESTVQSSAGVVPPELEAAE